jgi:hypothetical protein
MLTSVHDIVQRSNGWEKKKREEDLGEILWNDSSDEERTDRVKL